MQHLESTQLPEPQSDAAAQVKPAAFLSQVSPTHPVVQVHVPPVPVQAAPLAQLDCVQHLESTQLPESQWDAVVHTAPDGFLLSVTSLFWTPHMTKMNKQSQRMS